ncbi:hypothetical protein [Nocardioides ultimimeridianus]
MKDLLFLAADLWLMATTWTFGIKIWRTYRNQLLTLEYFVVAVSSTNFLLWSLLGAHTSSPLYDLAYALDAFSRSFGITLILVIGLLAVTHGYKPPAWVKAGATALAVAGALIFGRMHSDHLVHDFPHLALAVFYVVTNLLTTAFLAYFTMRLWQAGATRIAVLTGLVTAAATYVAVTYDFFPFSFDDATRTIFYTIALTVWGCQAITYYYAYKAMREHREATTTVSARTAGVPS